MKILIADDDRLIRQGLCSQLNADGFEAVPCEHGAAALKILTGDEAPPLAVLDWMMPGMTGPEVRQGSAP